jgi:hypothetical protein
MIWITGGREKKIEEVVLRSRVFVSSVVSNAIEFVSKGSPVD